MSGERNSHQPKTPEEFREYMSTTIIRGASPTLDVGRIPQDDSTDVAASPAGPHDELAKRDSDTSWFARQIKEELFRSILVVSVVALIGWFAFQVYSLNREVGVLQSEIKALQSIDGDMAGDLEKAEARLHRELDQISTRVLRLGERIGALPPTKNGSD